MGLLSSGAGGASPGFAYPYGGDIASQSLQGFGKQFANPLAYGLGFGSGPRAQHFAEKIGAGNFTGPLGDVIQGLRQYGPQAINKAGQVGAQIAGQAPQQYAQIRANLEQALAAQPGLLNSAQGGVNLADQMIQQVSDPSRENSLYQRTAQRYLDPTQQNAAARGLLDAGSTQGAEEEMLRDLALQYALREQELQSNAIQTQGQALGNYNQTGIGGAVLGQGLFDLASQYPQLAMLGETLPVDVAAQLLQLFMGGGAPGIQNIAQMTAPQPVMRQNPNWMGLISGLAQGPAAGLLRGG